MKPAGMDGCPAPSSSKANCTSRARGFGGIALAPEGLAQPIAEFAVLFQHGGRCRPGTCRRACAAMTKRLPALPRGDKSLGIGLAIGMRHPRQYSWPRRNRPAKPSSPRMSDRPGRPQDQSFTLQKMHDMHSPLSFVRGTKKGDGGPSPSHNGPPISWRPMSSAALFCRDLRRRIMAAITDTKVRRLKPVLNETLPSRSAKSVWSLPMPTPSPA